MEERIIDSDLSLVPYYPAEEITLPWYQDVGLCKQVDNREEPYTLERLRAMYSYLSTRGHCYYIRYRGLLVGDCTLEDNGDIAIVICKEYQNRHIGRRCVEDMISLAREKCFDRVTAVIYPFNTQSQKMFLSVGFRRVGEELYEFPLSSQNEKSSEHFPAGFVLSD